MQKIEINQYGICPQAKLIPSPNQDKRPNADDIRLIVIHNISLPPNIYGGDGVQALFTNQLNPDEHPYYAGIHTLKVSSHFFIRRDGSLLQFVPCTMRAWHAGASKWQDRENCNDFSIGIELEGSDFENFEPKQYSTLKILIKALEDAYPIEAITGHSDVAPGRKTDPGPYFEWDQISDLKS
jgi:AmpD protein